MKGLVRHFLLMLALAIPGAAEIVNSGGGVVAQVADGGGLQTAVTLVNLQDVAAFYILLFHNNQGAPLTLVTDMGTGDSFSGSLQPGASITITTAGVSSTNAEGWAEVQTDGVIGGTALYRVSVAPWIGAEATLPIDTNLSTRFVFNFDQTSNAATGIAYVNPLSSAITVTVSIRNENGSAYVTDTFTIPPMNHGSFVLVSKYPLSGGKRGTIQISTAGAYMNVLALRFSGASIASILPLTSVLW